MALSAETKAGAFFLLGLFLLGVFTFKVEDVGSFWKKSYVLKARFRHARGLKQHDPVSVSGVRVGEVRDLILQDSRVLVIMKISQDVRIYASAVARIVPSGLLGTKYIDISNGLPNERELTADGEVTAAEGIDVGMVLEKIDSAATELGKMMDSDATGNLAKLIGNLAKTSEDMAQGTGTIGKLVASDEMYKKLDGIATEFGEATASIKKLVKDNEKDIQTLIKNLSEASPQFTSTFAKVQELVDKLKAGPGVLPQLINDGKLYEDVKGIVKGVKQFAKELEEGKGLAHRLVADEKMAEDAGEALKEFRQVGKDVRDAVAGVQKFIDKVNKGEGTLQLLLTDRELYDDAKKVMTEVKETVRGVKEQIPVGTFSGLLLSAF